jgi:hypothetical protein
MSMKKFGLKFMLPEGAKIGPLTHLGNGEFVSEIADPADLPGCMKGLMVLEFSIPGDSPRLDHWEYSYPVELVDIPEPTGDMKRTIKIAQFIVNGNVSTELDLDDFLRQHEFPATGA